MNDELRPFLLQISGAQLEDLRRRLRDTRWPEGETVNDWTQGTPLNYLKELCHYWATSYDWRACEMRLNAMNQFISNIDGLDIHFLHVKSPHHDATPLLLTHGWPGSVVEFLDVIGPLSDPASHGNSKERSFHVICPSLPGFGFSEKPSSTGWGVTRIAEAWATLMARLGYDQYVAQGGDWGASVTTQLGLIDGAHLLGIHLNMVTVPPSGLDSNELTQAEIASLAALAEFQKSESAYSVLQATRPQTVGYGLVDSPAAQAAWIIEKFRAWSDCDGHPENIFRRDVLLDNIMLYWLSATGASSARLYWESFRQTSREPVHVPIGCTIYPKEIYRPSRRWAEERFSDLRYWNEADCGGHFAAMEQPSIFVEEIRRFVDTII